MMTSARPDVLTIGAGVSGLTTAVRRTWPIWSDGWSRRARTWWRERTTMTRPQRLRAGLLTLGGALLLPYALGIGLLPP